MSKNKKMTEFDVIQISDSVLSAVADIVFATKFLKTNPNTGLSEVPEEIEQSVRAIEMALSRLNDFTQE